MAETASSDLMTTRATIDVATSHVASTRIAFADEINVGETIATATAALLRTTAISGGSEVSGFVSGVTVDETDVVVAWTGEVLVPGERYVLVVVAILNTGDTIPATTVLVCRV